MTRTHAALALLLIAIIPGATSCQRGSTGGSTISPEPAEVLSAAELADRLDPGQTTPLSHDMPPWMRTALAGSPGNDALSLEDAKRNLATWFETAAKAGDDALLRGIPGLARATLVAERQVEGEDGSDPEVLLVLERIYRLVDSPGLVHNRPLVERILGEVVRMQARGGDPLGAAQIDQLSAFVFRSVERAHGLHHATLARLLREHPEHPGLPDALLATAGGRLLDADPELAVGLARHSVAPAGGRDPTDEQWLAVAKICHRALDADCAAWAQGELSDAAAADEDLLTLARAAKEIAELHGDADDLEPGLVLGQAWADLGRHENALATYRRLTEQFPRDARPWVGRVRAGLAIRLDYQAAFEILEQADPRDHLDIEWFEMAVGIRATAIAYHLLPQLAERSPAEALTALRPQLDRLAVDIDSLRGLGDTRGDVLMWLHRAGMEAWPSIAAGQPQVERVRGLLPQLVALHRRVPSDPYAYTLMLASAEFSADRDAALAVLDLTPPDPKDGAQVLRRLNAAIDLVATWDARDRAEQLVALADEAQPHATTMTTRRLILDARMVAHELGQPQDLAEIERGYRSVLPPSGADALLLNNLAVVVARQGRADEARGLFERAIGAAQERDRPIAILNALGAPLLEAGLPPHPDALALIDEIIAKEDDSDVGLLARAWKAALKMSVAEQNAAAQQLAQARDKAARTALRPRWSSHSGVLLRGNLQLGLGYASKTGLRVDIDVTGVPWLLVPCPVPISE